MSSKTTRLLVLLLGFALAHCSEASDDNASDPEPSFDESDADELRLRPPSPFDWLSQLFPPRPNRTPDASVSPLDAAVPMLEAGAGPRDASTPPDATAPDASLPDAQAPDTTLSLRWSSPAANTTLSGPKAELTLTGNSLVNVEVFQGSTRRATAVVAADGRSAVAVLDTTALADGPLTLTAHAWNSPQGTAFTQEADAGAITFIVSNAVAPCVGLGCTKPVWLSGTMGEQDAFGSFRGTPVGIVGIGYNNAPQLELRSVISLDPKWTVAPQFQVLDTTYSLIDRNRGDTWASAARGALDAVWRQGMQSVHASWGARKWLFIRPAHELNGQDLWYVARGEEADFKATWIRFYNIVQDELVKKGKPTFLTFCVNHEKWGNAVEVSDALYPGDAFVDVIGVDYYDNKRHLDAASWEATAKSTTASGNPRGIYTWLAFAKRHGKPIAFPEWGLQSETVPDNDNPYFIQRMNELFRANAGSGPGQVLYEQYFSAWDADRLNSPTFLPKSAAMYKSLSWSDGVGVSWPR